MVPLIATTDMRHIAGLTASLLLASALHAQDTTVVVVRHIGTQQDTNVVVRRLTPPPERAVTQRAPARYATRSDRVIAKDPRLGTMLSFVFPGGGQYYAGNQAKGLAITLLAFAAPIIGYNSVRHDDVFRPGVGGSDCAGFAATNQPQAQGGIFCRGRTDWTPATIGLGVGIVSYLYGVATAGTDVAHWNQAHGVRFVTAPGRMGFAVALP
jgi:hypothetical protein